MTYFNNQYLKLKIGPLLTVHEPTKLKSFFKERTKEKSPFM